MEATEKKTTTITGQPKQVQVIKPVLVENAPDIPKGKVYMVRMRPDGSEIPNSGVIVGENTYNRVYANNPQFQLKKKSDKY